MCDVREMWERIHMEMEDSYSRVCRGANWDFPSPPPPLPRVFLTDELLELME